VHYRYVARIDTAISICGARHELFESFIDCYHLCVPDWRYSDMRVRYVFTIITMQHRRYGSVQGQCIRGLFIIDYLLHTIIVHAIMWIL
jgi:hypothetical protein